MSAATPQYDVVIIGAGVSGNIIALQLGLAGKKVLILEAGAGRARQPRRVHGELLSGAGENAGSAISGDCRKETRVNAIDDSAQPRESSHATGHGAGDRRSP